jgi:hypothetical protein
MDERRQAMSPLFLCARNEQNFVLAGSRRYSGRFFYVPEMSRAGDMKRIENDNFPNKLIYPPPPSRFYN